MTLDYSEFRHHLAGLNMTEEQENQFMTFVWTQVVSRVDRAWGIGAAQIALAEAAIGKFCKVSNSKENKVKSDVSLKHWFTNAAAKEA